MSLLIHSARKLDADGQVDDFWMLAEAGTIAATGSGHEHPAADESVDTGGAWLVPGFLDLHGHGGGGFSFDGDPAGIAAALATHRAHGTTRSVLSLVANPVDVLRGQLATIADLVEVDPLVLGSHLEGPYLAPGRHGAHNPDFLHDPHPLEVEQLIGAARGTLRQLTIAPELPNAFETIDVLVEAGVAVAVGHTEADLELTRRAFDRGARILTHAFNAMPGIHHREPGPVVAAFEDDRVTIELVGDGVHVHPDVMALTFRSAPGRVALITDAMAAAGSDDGDYLLGSLPVEVRDGVARVADGSGAGSIAGSTLTQDAALRGAITAGVDARDAVEALTRTPARALGLDHLHGLLAPSFVADAVLLDHRWNVQRVWADGSPVG